MDPGSRSLRSLVRDDNSEIREDEGNSRSIILQQPLDVVEFDLRAVGIGEAAAELFEDAADALDVDLAGDLHREVVAEFATAQRTAERIGLVAAALLAAGAVAGTGAVLLAVAVALPHGFRHALRTLTQRLQRLALRIDGTVGIAFAETAGGVAHRVVGLIEAILAVALIARLPLLARVAALAGTHAALGKLFLQLLETVAQRLLV